ncbi:MAG: roadblock/LC7 domain-containing protein [Actinomycetota bacterium]|nr:roadblock/LC7 domain-containing protein [Actinomycetota bacterium]
MTTSGGSGQDLRWLLDSFVDQVPGISHAIVVSTDGLPMSASRGFPADRADQLAAIAAGLSSLTQGAARCFKAGAVRQMVVEMEQGYLFVMAVGRGSCLAALAATTSDLGLVGYEMSRLVARVGPALTPAARAQSAS